MIKPDLQRLLDLHELLNKFAAIERIVHIKRANRQTLESDTEHSYNLAMTAWFIADYFPNLDKNKVIALALVHDLVEVHAGDTFAFADKELLDSKSDREEAARQQLIKEWEDFPDLHTQIEEYEARQSPEACFVYALDKIMPMLAIYLNEGHTWHQENLTLDRIHNEKSKKIRLSPEIAPYWEELYDLLINSPELIAKS